VPLTAQQRQGLHGEGFIFVLASSAGLQVSRPTYDVDGVDWLISYPGQIGLVRSPKIEVQVKTWSAPVGDDETWSYRMTVPHFNAIAGPGFAVRRYLLLVTVPADAGDFAVCDADCMRLGHAAYWLSLVKQALLPVDGHSAKTIVVPVPRRNLLTPTSLTALVAGSGTEALA
jgi:hypothetical protein